MKIEGNKITADDGKIIVNKENSETSGILFYIGIHDSVDNYIEIDEPNPGTY